MNRLQKTAMTLSAIISVVALHKAAWEAVQPNYDTYNKSYCARVRDQKPNEIIDETPAFVFHDASKTGYACFIENPDWPISLAQYVKNNKYGQETYKILKKKIEETARMQH